MTKERQTGTPIDTSVKAFREKYIAGLLDAKPWTWPGETQIPLGAADPGI